MQYTFAENTQWGYKDAGKIHKFPIFVHRGQAYQYRYVKRKIFVYKFCAFSLT